MMRSCPVQYSRFRSTGRIVFTLLAAAGLFAASGLESGSLPVRVEARGGAATQPENYYVGAEVCASCHRTNFKLQSESRHAATWRLPGGEFSSTYPVELAGLKPQAVSVRSILGGDRFGFSSLVELDTLNETSLPRKTLIEARMMVSAATRRKTLSPGFSEEQPVSFAAAIGRVLSRRFAEKCENCHGAPSPLFRDAGVRCERCHGPGGLHVEAVKKPTAGPSAEGSPGSAGLQIIHPGKLGADRQLEVCAQCHAGFSRLSDPRPDELLISNQVTALRMSACFIRSGKRLTCLTCHNPHTNAGHEDPVYDRACSSCHESAPQDDKIHPTARKCAAGETAGCVKCHMPVTRKGNNFALVDHWIRVVERPFPENIRAMVARGAAMAERGQKPEAIRFLEALIPQGQDEPSLHYTLGLAYEETGKTEDALRSYAKAVELEPDMVAAHINIGSLLMSLRKIDEAILAFRKAADINPLETAAHYNLAIAYEKKQDLQAMKHELELVAAIDPRMRKVLSGERK